MLRSTYRFGAPGATYALKTWRLSVLGPWSDSSSRVESRRLSSLCFGPSSLTTPRTQPLSISSFILHPSQRPVSCCLDFRHMAISMLNRLLYTRDFAYALFTLLFARIYPRLDIPPVDLKNKVAIITGANSGIGYQIALSLTSQGATVYLACRTASKATDAIKDIIAKVPAAVDRVKTIPLDTSSLSSVKSFVEQWKVQGAKVDILVHNAGVSNTPDGQPFTNEGYPIHYATNFLGSFLLTHLMESSLSNDARVILTSSQGHYATTFSSNFSLESIKERFEPGFHVPVAAVKAGIPDNDSVLYITTKTMQVAFARLLQEHFDRSSAVNGKPNRRSAHAFSPGLTYTPMVANVKVKSPWDDPIFWSLKILGYVATDVSQGAATGVWLACTQDQNVIGSGNGGGYWDRMTRRLSKADMMDREVLERLWIRWEADAGIEWR